MNEQHTPGPWRSSERCHCWAIQPATGKATGNHKDIVYVMQPYPGDPTAGCITTQGRTHEECEANARLIAAAPELLEACRRSVRELDACKTEATITGQRRIRNTQTAILAAIAAAVAAPLTFDDDDD